MPEMTKATAQFLLDILKTVTLNAGAPDFEQAAERVLAARQELRAILTDPPPGEPVREALD